MLFAIVLFVDASLWLIRRVLNEFLPTKTLTGTDEPFRIKVAIFGEVLSFFIYQHDASFPGDFRMAIPKQKSPFIAASLAFRR